jgi:ubiquinone/menaquinone biosynthesis C-methylase UbiE
MTETHHTFVAEQYGVRAERYVESPVHSAGEDLDRIEAALRGGGQLRVLDLGCGGGHVAYRAAPHVAEVVAVDLTSEMLEAVKRTAAERGLRNVEVRQAAAEALPFPDGRFDVVLCRFSAHHWRDFEGGLQEAGRVLGPGGKAIFVDCIAPGDALLDTYLQTIELLRDPSHVRNYSAAEWCAALARAGLAVETLMRRRLRLEFESWIARTGTSRRHAEAIRSLQETAPAEVKAYFGLEKDGSFMLDTMTFEARRT